MFLAPKLREWRYIDSLLTSYLVPDIPAVRPKLLPVLQNIAARMKNARV